MLRYRPLLRAITLLMAALVAPTVANAQDFRVATIVSQRGAQGAKWNAIAHSVSLFHAGKVYDYMESVGEVVLFEPAQSQFVVLSFNGNNMATSIRFEELQQYLKVARTETESHIARLDPESGDLATKQRRAALAFQLTPTFDTNFDAATKKLTLISPLVRYEVETVAVEKPLVAQQYVQYADWTAKMNYILHNGALYPDVRLAVNQALSQHQVIPTEVRLHLGGANPMQLKAEHKYDWDLNSFGQSVIRQCEKARTADETNWVDFREYQRALVTSTAH